MPWHRQSRTPDNVSSQVTLEDSAEDRIYTDQGMTGTNRDRPGLAQALAAVREGDTLIVSKLDRLARSVPDARAIGDELAARGVRLYLGGTLYDPKDPPAHLKPPLGSAQYGGCW